MTVRELLALLEQMPDKSAVVCLTIWDKLRECDPGLTSDEVGVCFGENWFFLRGPGTQEDMGLDDEDDDDGHDDVVEIEVDGLWPVVPGDEVAWATEGF